MPSDTKHAIFISEENGGFGIQSFTCQYMGSLLRDVEVYISDKNSMTVHALISSLKEATKQCIWHLHRVGKIPSNTNAAARANTYIVSGKKTLIFKDNTETPYAELITYDRVHTMERVIKSTCYLGFMHRDLDQEFCSRFVDELLLQDKRAKVIASPLITTRANLGPCLGEGNENFFKYSILGHIYILLEIIIKEAKKMILAAI
jgi:hypothetical protein